MNDSDPDRTQPLPSGLPDSGKPEAAGARMPTAIGRYRVERRLGEGGFGCVYLAHDDQVQRPVAIKVPHARLIESDRDLQSYLREVRVVARLDHPNIDTPSRRDLR